VDGFDLPPKWESGYPFARLACVRKGLPERGLAQSLPVLLCLGIGVECLPIRCLQYVIGLLQIENHLWQSGSN